MTLSSFAILLVAVGLAVCGQLLLKHGMTLATTRSQAGDGSLVLRAMTSPFVLGGLAIFGISAIAWLVTLSRVPLSIAYPFNALGFIAITFLSARLLGERTNAWTWVGTGIVVAGLLLVVLTKPR